MDFPSSKSKFKPNEWFISSSEVYKTVKHGKVKGAFSTRIFVGAFFFFSSKDFWNAFVWLVAKSVELFIFNKSKLNILVKRKQNSLFYFLLTRINQTDESRFHFHEGILVLYGWFSQKNITNYLLRPVKKQKKRKWN